ncbi:hypothetical protein KJK32_45380 (plasmid) [Streptomyces sp. JCM17656]|nr:hypothetical protein KJK32_45380 [Streptomyces sp. JCM17656]
MAVHPESDAPSVPVTLPTENLFALRGLLQTGRLTPEQEPLARQKLADAAAAARQTTDPTSGDAA